MNPPNKKGHRFLVALLVRWVQVIAAGHLSLVIKAKGICSSLFSHNHNFAAFFVIVDGLLNFASKSEVHPVFIPHEANDKVVK